LKTTRYFEEQVLRKWPYIESVWIAPILAAPIRRVRTWGAVVDPRDGKTRYLRMVTLDDEETVHNAFFDRDFEDQRR
jgi:hypothetical protein